MNLAIKSTVCLLALAAWVSAASAELPSTSAASKSFDFLGFRMTILLAGTDTGGSSALLDVLIPASAGPPPHIHAREDEVYVIKRGTFQFFMDGICLQAGPGTTLYMPKGHMHTFKNISAHTGEQLLFVYPAGLEQFFRDVHDLGLKMPQDFNKLNELSNAKYGINHVPGHDFHAGACTAVAATNSRGKIPRTSIREL
jgi:mannose-6-phosphate isomerase-like protein (cupin superfamily)